MDAAEKIVEQYLTQRGYISLEHEPDGKVPPDFLLDGHIAIEVTRLNSHHFEDGAESYAHQSHFVPVLQSLSNLLRTFGPPVNGESWFVDFALIHPFKGWVEIRTEVKLVLAKFFSSTHRENHIVEVSNSLEIGFFKASREMSSFFVPAGGAEDSQGCVVVAEMHSNIQLLVNSKGKKIEALAGKYSQWWLALVDGIGFGIEKDDFEKLLSMNIDRGLWDKILLVNPRATNEAYEI